jgi:ribonucleotide monophosphatase NagD (HAD superfamily)
MASLAKRWGYAPTLENAQRALVDQTNEDLVRMGEKPTMTYEKYKEHLARSA